MSVRCAVKQTVLCATVVPCTEPMKIHLFLTGKKQVGKSTLLREILRHQFPPVAGFLTLRTNEFNAPHHTVHLLSVNGDTTPTAENLLFYCGKPADSSSFDRLGCGALADVAGAKVIVMDELGPKETNATAFQQRVLQILDGDTPVLGVLQQADTEFLRTVAGHPKVEVVTVTEENRESLAHYLRHWNCRHINSYGAVVIEKDSVLMVEVQNGWSFPKGHIEPNETPEETARREVFEETGITVEIDTNFSRTVSNAKKSNHGTVTFFLGRSLCGCPTPIPDEVPDARWIPLNEAADLIPYPEDRAMFQEAFAYWKAR